MSSYSPLHIQPPKLSLDLADESLSSSILFAVDALLTTSPKLAKPLPSNSPNIISLPSTLSSSSSSTTSSTSSSDSHIHSQSSILTNSSQYSQNTSFLSISSSPSSTPLPSPSPFSCKFVSINPHPGRPRIVTLPTITSPSSPPPSTSVLPCQSSKILPLEPNHTSPSPPPPPPPPPFKPQYSLDSSSPPPPSHSDVSSTANLHLLHVKSRLARSTSTHTPTNSPPLIRSSSFSLSLTQTSPQIPPITTSPPSPQPSPLSTNPLPSLHPSAHPANFMYHPLNSNPIISDDFSTCTSLPRAPVLPSIIPPRPYSALPSRGDRLFTPPDQSSHVNSSTSITNNSFPCPNPTTNSLSNAPATVPHSSATTPLNFHPTIRHVTPYSLKIPVKLIPFASPASATNSSIISATETPAPTARPTHHPLRSFWRRLSLSQSSHPPPPFKLPAAADFPTSSALSSSASSSSSSALARLRQSVDIPASHPKSIRLKPLSSLKLSVNDDDHHDHHETSTNHRSTKRVQHNPPPRRRSSFPTFSSLLCIGGPSTPHSSDLFNSENFLNPLPSLPVPPLSHAPPSLTTRGVGDGQCGSRVDQLDVPPPKPLHYQPPTSQPDLSSPSTSSSPESPSASPLSTPSSSYSNPFPSQHHSLTHTYSLSTSASIPVTELPPSELNYADANDLKLAGSTSSQHTTSSSVPATTTITATTHAAAPSTSATVTVTTTAAAPSISSSVNKSNTYTWLPKNVPATPYSSCHTPSPSKSNLTIHSIPLPSPSPPQYTVPQSTPHHHHVNQRAKSTVGLLNNYSPRNSSLSSPLLRPSPLSSVSPPRRRISPSLLPGASPASFITNPSTFANSSTSPFHLRSLRHSSAIPSPLFNQASLPQLPPTSSSSRHLAPPHRFMSLRKSRSSATCGTTTSTFSTPISTSSFIHDPHLAMSTSANLTTSCSEINFPPSSASHSIYPYSSTPPNLYTTTPSLVNSPKLSLTRERNVIRRALSSANFTDFATAANSSRMFPLGSPASSILSSGHPNLSQLPSQLGSLERTTASCYPFNITTGTPRSASLSRSTSHMNFSSPLSFQRSTSSVSSSSSSCNVSSSPAVNTGESVSAATANVNATSFLYPPTPQSKSRMHTVQCTPQAPCVPLKSNYSRFCNVIPCASISPSQSSLPNVPLSDNFPSVSLPKISYPNDGSNQFPGTVQAGNPLIPHPPKSAASLTSATIPVSTPLSSTATPFITSASQHQTRSQTFSATARKWRCKYYCAY